MTRPLELLVVENNPRYLADAEKFFESIEQEGKARITYAKTLAEAEKSLAAKTYDGIISNVYFPMGFSKEETMVRTRKLARELRKIARILGKPHLDSVEKWAKGRIDPPSCLYLADAAVKKGTPIILCTGEEHDSKFEPIYVWSRDKEQLLIRLVDCLHDAINKYWNVAGSHIVSQIYSKGHTGTPHGWFAVPFLFG